MWRPSQTAPACVFAAYGNTHTQVHKHKWTIGPGSAAPEEAASEAGKHLRLSAALGQHPAAALMLDGLEGGGNGCRVRPGCHEQR